MVDLFEEVKPVPAARGFAREPTLEQHARELLGMPPEWKIMSWTAYGPVEDRLGVLVEGAVAVEVFTKGKHKGRVNWAKRDRATECKIPVSDKDHKAWLVAWEHETQVCSKCKGKGQEWFGWHHLTGDKLRDCRRCGASGRAPHLLCEAPA